MKPDWQSINDVLYAHWYRIRDAMGKGSLVAALLLSAALAVWLWWWPDTPPSPLSITGLFVLMGLLIGYSATTMSGSWYAQRNTIRYRYKVFINTARVGINEASDWMDKQGMTFTVLGRTPEAFQDSGPDRRLMEVRLTRADHAMLVKMRF